VSGAGPLADPSRAFRLDGRVAVVTGASSGIGEALAVGLAGAGARVALAARRQDRLEALAERLRAGGADVHAFGCDVASSEDVERLARDVADRLGPAAVLVNNAGFGDPMPAEQEPIDRFVATLDVNLVGTFRCAQAFGRQMLAAGRGSIVNVASILGVVGVGQIPQGSYTASKGGW
jgi:NAD(P)-dependent dehydrogenase (short-subunit alcohol dehydrogenase family)